MGFPSTPACFNVIYSVFFVGSKSRTGPKGLNLQGLKLGGLRAEEIVSFDKEKDFLTEGC